MGRCEELGSLTQFTMSIYYMLEDGGTGDAELNKTEASLVGSSQASERAREGFWSLSDNVLNWPLTLTLCGAF